jgi:hypothetical protein
MQVAGPLDFRDSRPVGNRPARQKIEGGCHIADRCCRFLAKPRGLANGNDRLTADPLDLSPAESLVGVLLIRSRSVTITWNFRLELPALRTRTFIRLVVAPVPSGFREFRGFPAHRRVHRDEAENRFHLRQELKPDGDPANRYPIPPRACSLHPRRKPA